MQIVQTITLSVLLVLSNAAFPGCSKEAEPVKRTSGTQTHDDHDHGEAEHAHAPGHGGAVFDLGAATKDGFALKATRDEGQIVAGKDAPIDVTITPGAGETRKVAAVRMWIGLQDAKGSVKAKADVEDPKDPNRWHTHAEIPNPLPVGSMLWIEVETDKGEKILASFDLKS